MSSEAASESEAAVDDAVSSTAEKPVKIALSGVYKVFGSRVDKAVEMIEAGQTKDQILEETACTVGVNDATFEIREGEIFVVMGLSGSGKSTLLRLINRLIEPTLGSITVDGADVTRMNKRDLINLRRRDMSMVFQSFALLPNRTVVHNAAFGLEVAGRPESEWRPKALKALEAVGLGNYANSYPEELSGGMKQRVGLARALASEPTILLMDEAFSALDPLIRTEMQDELLNLQAEQARTVVFVSHDLDEAMRIGDRIAIMQDGLVVQVGTPEEIVMQPANDYVRSFFRGVDVTQVFRAGDVARQSQITLVERPGMEAHAALDTLRRNDREFAIVTSRDKHYQGMISTVSLAEALKAGSNDPYRKAFLSEVEPIESETSLTDVLSVVADNRWPVPVVDAEGRYLGVLSKASLLTTLDRSS